IPPTRITNTPAVIATMSHLEICGCVKPGRDSFCPIVDTMSLLDGISLFYASNDEAQTLTLNIRRQGLNVRHFAIGAQGKLAESVNLAVQPLLPCHRRHRAVVMPADGIQG